MLYFPPTDAPAEAIVVRASGDAKSLAPLAAIGRDLGAKLVTIDGVEAFIDRSVSEPRFVMLVMAAFSALGLAMATVGLYGVMAYTVAQETREIGIRVALGASRTHVVRRVVVAAPRCHRWRPRRTWCGNVGHAADREPALWCPAS
jgi:putative ABC transport system permease protein